MVSICSYPKILVIQTAFIGDAILASSVLESIIAANPKAELHLLVRSGNETLFTHHPYLHTCWTWNKSTHKIKHLIQLVFQIRKAQFDLVITLHRHLSSGLLAGFSNARYICGYKQNPCSFLFHFCVQHRFTKTLHETQRYLALLQEFTDITYNKPKLYPNQQMFSDISQWINVPFYVIAPGSVWFTKQAPLELWQQLCTLLSKTHTIFIIGAHSDYEICQAISKTNPNTVNLCGKITLLQAAALISKARMNYVNDSAPLHLASAMNAPVTAFFCSTTPEFGFGPLSEISHTIEVSNLICKPCGIHGFKSCPKGHFKCGFELVYQLQNIPV